MDDILARYLHFIGIMILTSMLVVENVMIRSKMDHNEVKKFAIIDGIYGFGAAITLIAGLLLWLYVGKPSDFYSQNILFMIKLTIFVVIALLSLIPTIFFIKQRKNESADIYIPKHLIRIKRIELSLLVFLPLIAVYMARGYGLNN